MPFSWSHTGHPRWKYRLMEPYYHRCAVDLVLNAGVAAEQSYFSISRDGDQLLLRPGYLWNGSNVVPDTRYCMRASAIHDAHCQAMHLGLLQPTFVNWIAAAAEYRRVCIADGMPQWRAWMRYYGIVIGGGNDYRWRGKLQQLENRT